MLMKRNIDHSKYEEKKRQTNVASDMTDIYYAVIKNHQHCTSNNIKYIRPRSCYQ